MNKKRAGVFHKIIFIIGLLIVAVTAVAALWFRNSDFYTLFCLGYWFVFDSIDYFVRKRSIIDWFFQKTHIDAFFVFLIVNTLSAFLIDYVYGVNMFGMWSWPKYSLWEFLRMYAFMTLFFGLAIYESFKVFEYLAARKFGKKAARANAGWKFFFFVVLLLGIAMLLFPPAYYFQAGAESGPWVMLAAFTGIWLVADGLNYFIRAENLMQRLFRGDGPAWVALAAATVLAFFSMEAVNSFPNEWVYGSVPFEGARLFNVPVSLMAGWIPLCCWCVALVNMVKKLDS